MIPSIASAQRVVVKIGSALVVDQDEAAPRTVWLEGMAADIASLRARGADVIVVSSGAIALARRTLGLHQHRLRLEEQQAAAAVGQIRLAQAWSEALSAKGLTAAQLLLTLDDTEDRRRYLNARATLNTLLGLGCIPVINENDTVATAEIRFGDNDRLAARVAEMMQADQLILLSDIDGLYTADPRRDPAAEHMPVVQTITPEIEAMGGEPPPGYSSGGMRTKLAAARIATQAGCAMAIAYGRTDRPLTALEKGARCTWFLATPEGRSARKRWIAGALAPLGALVVDAGAAARACRGAFTAAGRRARRRRHLRARRSGRGAQRRWQGLGARPVRLCQHRADTHRRPSLRRDRGHPRLARPRRNHPPRRPGLALTDMATADWSQRFVQRCTSRPKPPNTCSAPPRRARCLACSGAAAGRRPATPRCVRWHASLRAQTAEHPRPPTPPTSPPAPAPPHFAIAWR